MATIPFWDPVGSPSAYTAVVAEIHEWDQLMLGGKLVPGLAEVSATGKYKTDKKSAPGSSGGKTTSTGYQPTEVDIKVHIWTPDQWSQFQPILETLWPAGKKGTQKPTPVDVYHPELALLGIYSIEITGASTPSRGSATQEKVFHFKAIEFIQPKGGATNTPKASIAAVQITAPQLQTQVANPPPANGVKPKPSSNAGPR